jgi:hypothetical protein
MELKDRFFNFIKPWLFGSGDLDRETINHCSNLLLYSEETGPMFVQKGKKKKEREGNRAIDHISVL